MKRIALALSALTAIAIALAPASYATPDFDELRQENLDKNAVNFDGLRQENLDNDAVYEVLAKGVDFNELRRENLDKDAVNTDELRQANLEKGHKFDELRRANLDKDAAAPGAPWYEKLEEGVGL